MSQGDIVIRLARGDDADVLTDLALSSKASWGYSAEFIEACRAELTMTPEKLAAWDVWVAESGREIVGMVALNTLGGEAEVEDFFVEASFQGRGVGSALMRVLIDTCRARKISQLSLDADPNAEPIYARLGFVTIGRSPSGSIPGRFLPRMVRVLA